MVRYTPVRCPVESSHPDSAPLLAVLSKDSFFVKCTDYACRKNTPNHGWFEIKRSETGMPIIRPVPDGYHFDLENRPVGVKKSRKRRLAHA